MMANASVSRSTNYRAKSRVHQQQLAHLLDQLPSSSDSCSTDSNSHVDDAFSVTETISSGSSMDESMSEITCKNSDLISCVLGHLIWKSCLTKAQASAVVEAIKIILARDISLNEIPNLRSYWRKKSTILPQEYCFICKHGHLHDGYFGEPRFFRPSNCLDSYFNPRMSNGSYFVKMSLASLLRIYMNSANISVSDSDHQTLTCIQDGALARKARCHDDSLTLTMFTDEVPTSHSSKLNAFPIFIMVNEIEKKSGFDDVILCGIFHGKKKPEFSVQFLKPFVDELRELESNGIEYTCKRTGVTTKKKFKLTCIIADAPMRAYLRCVKQHNSRFGCDWCKIEGTSYMGSMRYRYKNDLERAQLARSKQDFIDNEQGRSTQQSVTQSIKSRSVLCDLESFDPINGFSVDILHAVYLGIVRDIMCRAWLNPEYQQRSFFIGSPRNKKIMNERLLSIKVHSEHPRPPRSIDEIKDWKGNEFASFLGYYFVPVLDKILPAKYLVHFGLLSEAIMYLQGSHVHVSNLAHASMKISKFVMLIEKLYGLEFCTYNSHILLHLPDSVRNLGPACSTSAFLSEDEMGKIKKRVVSFTNTAQNILNVNSLKIACQIDLNNLHGALHEHEKSFFGLVSPTKNLILHGKSQVPPSALLIQYLSTINMPINQNELVLKLTSIKYCDKVFTCNLYDNSRVRLNSCVKIHDDFFIIDSIFMIRGLIFIEARKLECQTSLNMEVRHGIDFYKCNLSTIRKISGLSQQSQIYKVDEIDRKIFCIRKGNINYLMIPTLKLLESR